jgi:hypothetical protein
MPAKSAEPQDGQERRNLPDGEDHEQQQRRQVDHRDVEGAGDRVERLLGADLGARVHRQPDDQGRSEAQPERRRGGPEHVADVLVGRRPRPTNWGTRIVVSDSGVILSPK